MFQNNTVAEGEDVRVERQLVAKYGAYFEVGWVEVELNGVPLKNVRLIFDNSTESEVNLDAARRYAQKFNDTWVLVQQVAQALSE